MKRAVFLYDFTGIMAKPWMDAGYECWCFDGQHEPGVTRDGLHVKVGMWFDAKNIEKHAAEIAAMVGSTDIVFGFPECTYLTVASARWLYHPEDKSLPREDRRPHPLYPNRKKDRAKAVELAKMVELTGDKLDCCWAAENPISMLSTLWRPYNHRFNPTDYAGYLELNSEHPKYPEVYPVQDRYNKDTCIWSCDNFVMPSKKRLEPFEKENPGWKKCGGKSLKTKNIRSATPRGFAQAVFLANT